MSTQQHFQALAELRERIRLEADKRVCRGILVVTSKEKAAEILADFDPKAISKGLYGSSKIELKAWSPAVEEGGRVFAARLYRNVDEAKVRQVFEFYGEISDLTLTPNKTNSCVNAVITYSKK